MPFMYATSNVVLEARLTAARAAALDELLPGAIPNDLNWLITNLTTVLADVAGLGGAAMRGTDLALLAANYLGLDFTPYTYGPQDLADTTSFIPPNKTIMLSVHALANVVAEEDYFYFQAAVTIPTLDMFLQAWGENKQSLNGFMYCDGTSGLRNNSGAAVSTRILGLSMA